MSDTENQMGLFELGESPPATSAPPLPPTPAAPARPRIEEPTKSAAPPAKAPPRRKPQAGKVKKVKAPARAPSGLVPAGDVRLTANIRQDLHLKLKIASAYRRTTIGEIIEELVEKYL